MDAVFRAPTMRVHSLIRTTARGASIAAEGHQAVVHGIEDIGELDVPNRDCVGIQPPHRYLAECAALGAIPSSRVDHGNLSHFRRVPDLKVNPAFADSRKS